MIDSARNQAFIFVTGASRSGTTVLSRVIGNAEPVETLNELHFFGELTQLEVPPKPLATERAVQAVAMTLARHARDYWVEQPTAQEWMTARRIVSNLEDADLVPANLFALTMAEIVEHSSAARICEQTPRNIYYARQILEAFPNARIVHVMRDPRAVLASQKARHKIRKLGGSNVPSSEVVRLWLNYHPFSMLRLWCSATREALALQTHERFRIVRYEDLITEPEETIKPLCEFLDLDYSSEMLDVPHWGSSTVEHSESAGLSSAALDKWQTVLDGAEIAYCERRTRQERKTFAYADSDDSRSVLPGYLGMGLRLPIHVAGALLANPGRVLTVIRAMFRRQT
jgi:hypothetical protein